MIQNSWRMLESSAYKQNEGRSRELTYARPWENATASFGKVLHVLGYNRRTVWDEDGKVQVRKVVFQGVL